MRSFSGPRGREGAGSFGTIRKKHPTNSPGADSSNRYSKQGKLGISAYRCGGLGLAKLCSHCYARHLHLLQNSFRYKKLSWANKHSINFGWIRIREALFDVIA
jgi:hypothetical protein